MENALRAKDLAVKGENGRKLVEEKYSWDSIVMELVALYEHVLS